MTPLLALSQTAINFTYLVAAVLLIVGTFEMISMPMNTARTKTVMLFKRVMLMRRQAP